VVAYAYRFCFRQARKPGLAQDFDAVFAEGCARRDDTFGGDVGAVGRLFIIDERDCGARLTTCPTDRQVVTHSGRNAWLLRNNLAIPGQSNVGLLLRFVSA
jgi:hypothetical protein